MSGPISSYDRVKTALEHREPDRIPFDLGGSVVTGMHRVAYANLRRYLGLPERPIEVANLTQQLARIDDDVADRLAVDVRALDPDPPRSAPLATGITIEGDSHRFTNEWGIAWRMPLDGGLYYDMCGHPLAGAESVSDIERFAWPDPLDAARFASMKGRADEIVHGQHRAYILGRNSAGILEMALWLRGFENFFMDLALNPAMAEALLDRITEIKIAYWSKALETVGENVLIVSEADDLATQQSLMMSKDMYRRFVFPRHQRLFAHIKATARAKVHVFYHSCGAVMPLIPMLIEEGVDILNPVQVSAAGMDTRELKRQFGKDLTFWGGGVDTQRILPRGTPQQVRDEVKRRIDDLSPGGGFVFTTVHNCQADVPPENYMAMWETLQGFSRF